MPNHKNLQIPRHFLDTEGNYINAHGGGILYDEGVYYWYGECRPTGPASLNARIGISCYSSKDLFEWKNEGICLPVVETAGHDLETGCKIERPKCLYCAKTRKFVLFWHHDIKGFGHLGARAGLALADSPTGPFEFVHSFRPWEEIAGSMMFRDCTAFQDDDGSAYLIFATDDNANLAICRLNDQYTEITGPCMRFFPGRYMEAPCLFKRAGYYYLIASDCTSWAPNEARSAVARSILGPWKELGNPCLGEGAEITFGAQGTYVQPVVGQEDTYLFMADRWKPEALHESEYFWAPITFRKTVAFWPERPFIQNSPARPPGRVPRCGV